MANGGKRHLRDGVKRTVVTVLAVSFFGGAGMYFLFLGVDQHRAANSGALGTFHAENCDWVGKWDSWHCHGRFVPDDGSAPVGGVTSRAKYSERPKGPVPGVVLERSTDTVGPPGSYHWLISVTGAILFLSVAGLFLYLRLRPRLSAADALARKQEMDDKLARVLALTATWKDQPTSPADSSDAVTFARAQQLGEILGVNADWTLDPSERPADPPTRT
ncbi:hypothetical protein AB0M43_04095 [Longispora sp. NPDC051575]|uniref:hypothetical protein n=1 Tax=Longispora sp. NPDC051575 TaxID=3154943 RepID=UPI003443F0C7